MIIKAFTYNRFEIAMFNPNKLNFRFEVKSEREGQFFSKLVL